MNASLVPSGLSNAFGLAVSGSNLFVTNIGNDTIGEYGTDGSTVNPSLVSGLSDPTGLVLSGSDLFVTNQGPNTIGEYGTDGSTMNASLVSGLHDPLGITVDGSNLFVATWGTSFGNGTIGEYTTSGTTVNPALVSGMDNPFGIVVVDTPEPSTVALLAAGAIGLVGYRLRQRRQKRFLSLAMAVTQHAQSRARSGLCASATAIFCFPSHAADQPESPRRAA